MVFCGSLLLLISLLAPVQGSWLSDATGINIDINKQVGTGIEAMSAPTVQSFEQSGGRLIDQADQKFAARLGQFNDIATAQIAAVNQVLTGTISSIDGDISKQLAAADELIEKRLGNVDTIAAKSALTIENIVARLIFLGCIMIFTACAVWRLYVLGFPSWTAQRDHSVKDWVKKNWWQLTWQVGGAGVSLLILCGLFWITGPHGDVSKLSSQHDQAYRAAMRALDFRQARYHAAQLKILDASNQTYLGYEMKANLLQDVLMRPALYQTLSGLRELSFRMSQAQSYLGDDPDVRVVGAFVAWNSGGTKAHQYVSAVLCADALSNHSKNQEASGEFVLRPLAIEYLKDYLLNPLPDELIKVLLPTATNEANKEVTIAVGQSKPTKVRVQYPTTTQLYETLARAEQEGASPSGGPTGDIRMAEVGGPMSHIVKFDQILRALYRKEIPAYLKMIEADRKFNDPAFTDKNAFAAARQSAARDITSAWQSFDRALATDTDLADSVAPIRSMTLNDSFLTKADAFTAYTDPEKANKVAYTSKDHKDFLDSYVVTHVVADTPTATDKLQKYVSQQRAQLVTNNDTDLTAFTAAMIEAYKMGSGQPASADFAKAKTAALLAAKLGLFTCGSGDCQSDQARPTQFAVTIGSMYTSAHQDATEQNGKFVLAASTLDPDLSFAYNSVSTVLW
jgi:hypothetical protein